MDNQAAKMDEAAQNQSNANVVKLEGRISAAFCVGLIANNLCNNVLFYFWGVNKDNLTRGTGTCDLRIKMLALYQLSNLSLLKAVLLFCQYFKLWFCHSSILSDLGLNRFFIYSFFFLRNGPCGFHTIAF